MKQLQLLFFYPLLFTCTGLITQEAAAQISYSQISKLLAGDGAVHDLFGNSVAISADGNTAVIGAPYDSIGTNAGQGSAYVFTRSGTTWTQQAKLISVVGASGDYFGCSVAISNNGNTVVIGDFQDDNPNGLASDQGSAYVFSRSGTTWTQQAQLIGSSGTGNDYFGYSVAIGADGNTIVIGAFNKKIGISSGRGCAYVFSYMGTSWTQQAQLIASDGFYFDYFGYSVAVSADGNTAVIGAAEDDVGINADQGSAYVFTRSGTTWTQQVQLTASDGAPNDFFGRSITISADGSTIVIGTPEDDVSANTGQGSAYVFTRNGTNWIQQAQLTASDGASNDFFGRSVSISADGNTAVIGAADDDVGTNAGQGSVYVFTRSGPIWTQRAQLTASDGATDDFFGFSVSISGNGSTVLIGAPSDDVTATDQGSAYIFVANSPLPINLSDFSATKQAGTSLLNWKMAREQNIATYIIERSSDGSHFTTAGTITSLGNTSTSRTYHFTDVKPLTGANYYRIKTMEQNGKTSYSEVRLLNFGSQINIALFPNPAKDKAILTGVEAGMSIRLLNVAGQVLRIQKAGGTTESILLRGLSKGLYHVKVYSVKGAMLSTAQLMKE